MLNLRTGFSFQDTVRLQRRVVVARGEVVSSAAVVRTILVSIACKPTAAAALYYIAWHASQLVAAAVEKLPLLLLSAANAQPFKTLEA